MGLSRALARLASRRLHVLLVEHPGGFVTRSRAERAVTARGWVLSTSPADADALLECGDADGEQQTAAVEHVWAQVPGPRSRGRIGTIADIEPALDTLDADYRRWAARQTRPEADPGSHGGQQDPHDGHDGHDGSRGGGDDMDGEDMGDMDTGDMDMGDMDTGDMDTGDMDMGDMDMSGPGGIALAPGWDDDRDGLEMDVLRLPLGPVLSSWPAGLAVIATLSGDVIVGVEVDVSTPHPRADLHADWHAYRLDAAARVLDLTGAAGLAARARTARDRSLDGGGPDLVDLSRRVARSRALRSSLRRVGPVGPQQAADHGWPRAWVGDAYDRLLRLTAASTETPCVEAGLDIVANALPRLLVGCELATARLTVASLVGHPS